MVDQPPLTTGIKIRSYRRFALKRKCLIVGLSQLELGLLISVTRLETFHALETFNFNMVYEVYSSLVSRARTHLSSVTALAAPSVMPGGSVQLWGRDIAARAWERLGEIGLWSYSGRGEGRGRFVRCEVGMIEVAGICERRKLLNSAMRGWFKEGI
jgi:Origin recognition complex (ORC) subunit 4 C-terminus